MLEAERAKIDQLDQEIVNLLEERMTVVTEVARIKKAEQLAILDSNREAVVLEKIASYVKDPAYCQSIVEIYEALMASSKKYQQAKNQ